MKVPEKYLPIYICHDLNFNPRPDSLSHRAHTSAHTYCQRYVNKYNHMNIWVEYDLAKSEE